MNNNSLDMLRKELERWQGVAYSVEKTGRHPRLWVEYRGRKKFVPFSSTHVGKYGLMQKVTQLRRALREIGAEHD
jgi:hypothetical protein